MNTVVITDVLTAEQRRFCMSRIHGKNTKPEMAVRQIVHALGYRYRLHCASLPGKPDIVFAGRRKVIFVHGCFWHMHQCKYGCVTPKANAAFWQQKRSATVLRDAKAIASLEKSGWTVLVVWECEVRAPQKLAETLVTFLGPR